MSHKKIAVLIFALSLSGCSVLASKEAAVGCQVADIASTAYALHHNPNAYETGPVPVNLMYALKLGLSYFIWQWEDWKEAPEPLRIAVTVIGCYPVRNNLEVARK